MRLFSTTFRPFTKGFLTVHFNELNSFQLLAKTRYSFVQQQRNTCGWHTDFFSKWFKKGIVSIKDLLTEIGNFLTFQEFSLKYSCQTNLLQYYQVISAIPKHLLSIAKQADGFSKPFFTSNDNMFPLSETVQINLCKVKLRDDYKLLNAKPHLRTIRALHAGTKSINK